MRVMRTVNLLLATFTVVAGFLAWVTGHVTTFQKGIAGIYIVYVLCVCARVLCPRSDGWCLPRSVFGLLLLAFEMRPEKIDKVLRLNFGFMYGNKTRTAFLVL